MLKCPTTLIPASIVQIFLWYATRQDIRETAATSGHVTTASLKLVIKEYMAAHFLSASIHETSHSKLRDPKQYNVKVSSWSDR